MRNVLNEYCRLHDLLDSKLASGMNDLDPTARSIGNKMYRLLKTMNKQDREKAYQYRDFDPERYW